MTNFLAFYTLHLKCSRKHAYDSVVIGYYSRNEKLCNFSMEVDFMFSGTSDFEFERLKSYNLI